MSIDDLEQRFAYMLRRLDEVYDGLGHSSGRPYLYFVYPPSKEQMVRKLADEQMIDGASLRYLHLDLVPVTIETLRGQEDRRAALLNKPGESSESAIAVMGLWVRQVQRRIQAYLDTAHGPGRPVVVLRGLAALYPVGNPTSLMEAIAEEEPRDPLTDRVVPFVLLVPGNIPPQSGRTYDFLNQPEQRLSFYRGEAI